MLLLLPAVVLAFGACGGEPSPAERARAIEGQVWSPYCPGRLLAECSTRQSDELRERIESRLRAGESPEAVLAWLEENYGSEILARPPSDARGLTAWLVPAAVLVAAGLVVGGMPKPHLVSYRERIAIDGEPIAPDEFAAAVERVLPAVDRVAAVIGPPTEFEMLTAVAVSELARREVDLAVVEVGLGGRRTPPTCSTLASRR